jgi:hypothetical protein
MQRSSVPRHFARALAGILGVSEDLPGSQTFNANNEKWVLRGGPGNGGRIGRQPTDKPLAQLDIVVP